MRARAGRYAAGAIEGAGAMGAAGGYAAGAIEGAGAMGARADMRRVRVQAGAPLGGFCTRSKKGDCKSD